jgi:hypothetical protein
MINSMLTKWYANPQSIDEARSHIIKTSQRLQQHYRRGTGCRFCQLQLSISAFWLGEDVKPQIEKLLFQHQNQRRFTALINLVYGQLLMSQRLKDARYYLDEGFKQASPLLTNSDYFKIHHQHQLLKIIPLEDKPLPATDLKTLINMAEVISKFPQQEPRKYHYDPSDLYG